MNATRTCPAIKGTSQGAQKSNDSRVAVATAPDGDRRDEVGGESGDESEEKVGSQTCSTYSVALVAGSHAVSYKKTLMNMDVT